MTEQIKTTAVGNCSRPADICCDKVSQHLNDDVVSRWRCSDSGSVQQLVRQSVCTSCRRGLGGKAVGRSEETLIGNSFVSIKQNVCFEVFHRTLQQDDNIIID